MEKLRELERYKVDLGKTMEDLDEKLSRTITKQEHQYLLTYCRFVTEKTKQLNELVEKLNEKAANRTAKD